MVCHGIYALLRHPIYTSLIFLAFGWSLAWGSVAGLVISAVMTLFLMAKLADEESRLKKRFPDYKPYMKKTKRLIP
ncbi:MAG: methyltransferase [Akkermansiaceae bacterium]